MHRKASKARITRENMKTVDANELEIVIRPMEPRDAVEVTELIEQLGYRRPLPEVVQWIESLAARKEEQAAFVACAGNAVVGWIELSIEHRLQSSPYSLIGGLVVKDGFRGRRIGLRLCEQAECWTWDHGISVIRVTSRSTRPEAHRFYELNGYRPTKLSHVFEKERPQRDGK